MTGALKRPGAGSRRVKLAVVLSHPTQYYSPWFRELAAESTLHVRVFYLWEFGVTTQRDPKFETAFKWDVDLLSGYEHEFVPNIARHPGTDHFRGLNNPDLTSTIGQWNPDVILLYGYKWLSHVRLIAWARWRRIPLLFRGDSHFLGRAGPTLTTRVALGALYAQFSAFLPVGLANRDYFTALGVPPERMFFAPHAVDHRRFDPVVPSHREAAATLRTQLGLSERHRAVLFAGKFVPEKQPLELLREFLRIARPDDAIVFVGDGPEKAPLHELARAARPGAVHFLPFANQSEMPSRYLLANIVALPSVGLYETWGLAVNEAMHMGRACLVSDRVGCQRDLVQPGQTGWVFPATDAVALRSVLDAALHAAPVELRRLQSNALSRIQHYTYASATAGLQQALAKVATNLR